MIAITCFSITLNHNRVWGTVIVISIFFEERAGKSARSLGLKGVCHECSRHMGAKKNADDGVLVSPCLHHHVLGHNHDREVLSMSRGNKGSNKNSKRNNWSSGNQGITGNNKTMA